MKVHWCLVDRECRAVGAPPRFHLDTAKRHWWLNPLDWRDRGSWKKESR